MNKRKDNLIFSLCRRLCEILEERHVIYLAQRPNLRSHYSEQDQALFATVTKTEDEIAREEKIILEELESLQNINEHAELIQIQS